MIKIGHGYDVHKFAENRKLILGGVEIPYTMGLLGHSDADVLTHSVCDALLGALSMGDIGRHFPDSDEKYKGINSLLLLDEVVNMVKSKGFYVGNIDVTVIAQAPKLAPYIEEIKRNLSKSLEIEPDCVNIKATTEEGLGFTGRKEGISAHCVCLIIKDNN